MARRKRPNYEFKPDKAPKQLPKLLLRLWVQKVMLKNKL